MSAAVEQPVEPAEALARLARIHAELDALAAIDLTGLTDDQLLDFARDKERIRRRLAVSDHAFLTELQARSLPATLNVRPAPFLRWLLRIDAHEANSRIKAAAAAGPRRAVTGEPLAPIYPAVAAAQATGAISERHAKVIIECVDKLPDAVAAEHDSEIETQLVEFAGRFDPIDLAKLALRISDYYDPDARLKDLDYRAKHRGLSVTQRPDGSCTGKFEGTAEFAEFLLLAIDAFGKPAPETDGFKDPRSAEQRRHDALLDALKLNVRAGQLPTVAGVTATVILTMTADDYEQRKGLARTGHGALVPVEEGLRMTGNEYRLMNVVIDKTKGITAYSPTARLFPEGARLAMAAHDGGCTFPNCPAPPGWCEIDHIINYAQGGPTLVDHGVPACRVHNVLAKAQGWQSTRINGRAAWIPPPWIDPEQKPRYNHFHDTGLGLPQPE